MVEVKLDLTEAGARELGESFEEVWVILFTREEEPVARWAAIAVAKRAERGVALGPHVDPLLADRFGGAAPARLVVVAQREQQVARRIRLWRPRTPHEVAAVIADPVLEVLLA